MFSADGVPQEIESDGESVVPVTSLACKSVQPCKQKEKTLKVSDAKFERLLYSKPSKDSGSLIAFDPRLPEYRGNAVQYLPRLLQQVKGKGLEKLTITEEEVRDIEAKTRAQRNSPDRFEARKFRITASLFGIVKNLKQESSPRNIVLQILGVKQFRPTTAMQWGIDHEEAAVHEYEKYKHANGHCGLFVCSSGTHISTEHPFLGASPDACVYDPNADDPYGFLEVKCPHSQRDKTPTEACHDTKFCCTIEKKKEGWRYVHTYPKTKPPLLCTSARVDGHWGTQMVRFCCFYTAWHISGAYTLS